MFKRIGLFLLTNIAVILLLTSVFLILEHVFGIVLSGYSYYLVFAGIIGFGGAIISLLISKWMAKRAYKFVFLTSENYDSLDEKQKAVYNTVSDLAERNNITIPEIGIYGDNEPNAFATGPSRNKSLVAVSTGLLVNMDKGAIEGVIAHEMVHILNGDMITMTLLQGVVNTFVIFISRIIANIISSFLDEDLGFFAYMAVVMLLEAIFGLLAAIVVMAFSRHREYKADAGSAMYVGKDKMIAGLEALKKMQNITRGEKGDLATMKISTKKRNGFMKLWASHPDLDDRIKALEELRL